MKKLLVILMILAMGIVIPNLADARHHDDDRDPCSYCRGWGDCPKCKGKGYTEEYDSNRKEWYEETCIECHGSGKCRRCHGWGWR